MSISIHKVETRRKRHSNSSQSYGRIVTQLMTNFDERSARIMRSILGWIAFAKRPLRSAEFRSALAFRTGDSQADELVPQYLFDMCVPIVEKHRDSTFRFIHVSVREYVTNNLSKCPNSAEDHLVTCRVLKVSFA